MPRAARTVRSAARLAALLVVTGFVGAADAQPARPQTPTGPFPYRSEDVTVPVGGSADAPDHTLGGTLTLPDAGAWGDGPYPAVVLITGSGPQDRDCTIFGHKPFLVIADHLTRRGVAVLRYDDRGVGASTGSFAQATTRGFAEDAGAAVDFLRRDARVDPGRVGVLGHSEGGLVAPLVATEHEGVAFVVLLAGTGVDGGTLMLGQSEVMFRAGGQDEAWIGKDLDARRAVFDAVRAGADDEAVRARLYELMDIELSYVRSEESRHKLADQALYQFASPWARQFITLDPVPALSKIAVPVLAMNGTLDTQVPPDQNLTVIERTLAAGPCPSYACVRLKGLNHLFQPATTGLLGEYAAIETTFDERALGVLSGWVEATVGVEGP